MNNLSYFPLLRILSGEATEGSCHDYAHQAGQVNIEEAKEAFKLHAMVPGFKKDEIKVSLDQGTLYINAAKAINKDAQFLHQEHQHYFSRSFVLPDNVDGSKISASYEDGVLALSLPKITPPAAQQIAIS